VKLYFHVKLLQAKEWVETFTSLGSSCQGYTKEKVTPYMHSMVYHVPRMMTLHKGVRKFSGQGNYYQLNRKYICIYYTNSQQKDPTDAVPPREFVDKYRVRRMVEQTSN